MHIHNIVHMYHSLCIYVHIQCTWIHTYMCSTWSLLHFTFEVVCMCMLRITVDTCSQSLQHNSHKPLQSSVQFMLQCNTMIHSCIHTVIRLICIVMGTAVTNNLPSLLWLGNGFNDSAAPAIAELIKVWMTVECRHQVAWTVICHVCTCMHM